MKADAVGGVRRRRPAGRLAARALGTLLVLAGVGSGIGLAPSPANWPLGGPAIVSAAEPTPTPVAGDPRSVGEGPGLVGTPMVALAGVVVVGLASLVLTLAYIRLTGGPAADRRADRTTGRNNRSQPPER